MASYVRCYEYIARDRGPRRKRQQQCLKEQAWSLHISNAGTHTLRTINEELYSSHAARALTREAQTSPTSVSHLQVRLTEEAFNGPKERV